MADIVNLQSSKTLLILVVIGRIAFGETPDDFVVPPSPAPTPFSPLVSPVTSPPSGDVTTMTPSWQMSPLPATDSAPTFTGVPLAAQGWFARGETMFLTLSHGSTQPLVYDLIDIAPHMPGALVLSGPVVTTNDISSQTFAAVPRLTFGYRYNDGSSVEATYFGRNDWSGSASAASAPSAIPSVVSLVSPDSLVVDKAATSLSSTLNSFEINAIEPFEKVRSLEFLAGLRYFGLSERFQFHTDTNSNGNQLLSNYSLQTANNLYGAQIGLRWSPRWNRFSLSGTCKTGIYANATSQNQFLDYSQNANELAVRNLSVSRPTAAFIQELGLNGVYQLTDAFSIRAGYNLFVISGVARASDQIDFSSSAVPSLSAHSNTLLHGPSAGFEIRF